MEFIAGAIIGGLLWVVMVYIYLKGRYEKEIIESYNRGYQAASELEKDAFLSLVEELANSSLTCDPDDDLSEGSEG